MQMTGSAAVQEAALLRLAERQAGREEELAQARQRAEQAELRAEDLEQDLSQMQQQVAVLKEVSCLLLFRLTFKHTLWGKHQALQAPAMVVKSV